MSSPEADRRAEELARKAARLLRRGRPAIEKAVTDARPRVEKAARGAWDYAQEHEDEIKRTALKAARLRVRGPFGFVFDAVSSAMREDGERPQNRPCASCGTENVPSARFCSHCGTRLAAAEDRQQT
jgi:hypothetical protein